MNQAYSFIDVAALDAVRLRFAAGEALAILNVELDEVIWANGPGAALLGFSDVEEAMGARAPLDAVARRQIAAAPGFPKIAGERSLVVRLRGALLHPPVRILLRSVELPDGEVALLLAAVPALSEGTGDPALALSGFNQDDQRVAFVDRAGAVVAAAPGFERLGLSQDEIAAFCASVAESTGRVAKKRLKGKSGFLPAGIAHLSDEPSLYFLIVIDGGETLPLEPAARHEQLPEPEAQALEPAVAVPDAPAPAPARFTWRTDADGRFSALSAEFIAAVGNGAAELVGQPFRQVAQRLGFDRDGEIASLLERRDTWSGRSVLWPLADGMHGVPVDLAALPVYDRERHFQGFRGFGMVRLGERSLLEEPGPGAAEGAGLPAQALPEGANKPVEAAVGEAAPGEREAHDPFGGEPPVLLVEPAPAPGPDEKIIRLAAHRQALAERAGLSPVERNAFREIGDRLKAVDEDKNGAEDAAAERPAVAEANGADHPPAVEPLAAGEPAPADPDDGAEEPVAAAEAVPALAPVEPVEDVTAAAPISVAVERDAAPSPTSARDDAADGAVDMDAQHAIEGVSRRRKAPLRAPSPMEMPVLRSEAEDAPGEPAALPVAADSNDVPAGKAQAAVPASAWEAAGDGEALPQPAEPELDRGLEAAVADDTPVHAADLWVGEGETSAEPDADSVAEGGEPAHPAAESDPDAADEDAEDAPELPGAEIHELFGPGHRVAAEARANESEPQHGQTADRAAADGRDADLGLLDALPLAVLICQGDRLHFANRAFFALTGHASLQALRDAGGLDGLIAPPLPEEGAGDDDAPALLMRHANGAEEPVSVHLRSVPWNGGKSLMLSLRPQAGGPEPLRVAPEPAMEDDALAREAEAELERTLALLDEMRTIVDTATDGVVLITPEGTIRMLSRPAEALFNTDAADVAGKPFTTLFAIESQRAIRDYLNGLTDNGVASVLNDGREVIGREAQGRFIPLFMTIGRLPGDRGFCAVVRDITQWKRAEEELTQARSQAERTSLQKTEFLARVSHEIRTPLNAIIGFSELMMEERFGPISNERYRDYLRDINRSGNHVLDLVNDLLDISKIEAGEQELSYVAVSLNDALAEAVAIMQPQANRERVIIRSSFASRLPDVVADLRSVRQIALNLLSNAVRYTQAGGQVIVSTVYEGGEVILRIRDTGVGMSSAEIDQALKPFKQINALKRGRGDGTGLGLPLTKAMVEANRARFSINSKPAEGTLIEITFPSTRVLAD